MPLSTYQYRHFHRHRSNTNPRGYVEQLVWHGLIEAEDDEQAKQLAINQIKAHDWSGWWTRSIDGIMEKTQSLDICSVITESLKVHLISGGGIYKERQEPLMPTKARTEDHRRTVSYLLDLAAQSKIVLTEAPDPNWTPSQDSQFIESIMIRMPIEPFWIDMEGPPYVVVRGLEKLYALIDFVYPVERVLRLRSLQYLKDLEGMTYDQLSRPWQRRLMEHEIIVYSIVGGNTGPDEKEDLYRRIKHRLC